MIQHTLHIKKKNRGKFTAAANQNKDLNGVRHTYQANMIQYQVDIDYDKALALGINLNEIYSTLSCVDYIIDAGNKEIIYEKPRVVFSPQTSHSSHGDNKKRRRSNWRRW